ncbi:helix-turn-helix domain-containing protein [Brevibacillus laterosporus]|uniref:helix-turn-helix domain-containing protein n=1 Tax=Brevibacillus laterosporus TaxID=1465 RepID=UPI001EF28EC7|nr:helix-turn-helix domain-containing protein [Brevibacillus laterosporus]MCG7319778.1 helix-turn-helix domain-containing protein [Brevibacillus laterosporus]
MAESLTFTSLGELIKEKRKDLGLSISELSRKTGVSKGVLSKIESGETKRPELRTLKPIAEVLKIPFQEIMEWYIELEHRDGILNEFLMEVAEVSNLSLMEKVAVKFLESSKKDTYESLENLFEIAGTFGNKNVRLTLYNVIIKYSRTHGVSQYIAKGLYQKYIIEREDLKHLEESFKVGEECLHYVDFLSQEEKITLYYRMALHAHNIKKYDKCVELGKIGHAKDATNNELKERVALAICNSYFYTNKFEEMKKHLQIYEQLGYQFILKRVKYLRAIILAKTGQYQEAVPLLRECVEEEKDNNRLHRVNQLVEALLSINDVDSVQEIVEREEKNFSFDFNNVYHLSELGKYFKNKGAFLVDRGLFDEGMESYLQGMNYFSKINALNDIVECAEDIHTHHCEQGKEMNLGLLKKMK